MIYFGSEAASETDSKPTGIHRISIEAQPLAKAWQISADLEHRLYLLTAPFMRKTPSNRVHLLDPRKFKFGVVKRVSSIYFVEGFPSSQIAGPFGAADLSDFLLTYPLLRTQGYGIQLNQKIYDRVSRVVAEGNDSPPDKKPPF